MLIVGCFYAPTGTPSGADPTGGTTGTTSGAGTMTDAASSTGEVSVTVGTTTGDMASSTGEPGTGSVSTTFVEEATTGGTTGPDCGDYVVERGEACDQGPLGGPNCTANCELSACGDGEISVSEECDDGNVADDDDCVACKKAVCGDGAVHADVEECDAGGESANCNSDCSLAMCGDAKLNSSSGELCDSGVLNGVYGGECAVDCTGPGPSCGDGMLYAPNELCEPALALPFATCNADCLTLACDSGRGDCDDKVGNGCEADLNTDEDNCGLCDKPCNIFKCIDGVCKP